MRKAILARDTPRSERNPDLETATANLAMHPVTGSFADPALESAFAVVLFRLAFPGHALLLTLTLAILMWALLSVPFDLWSLEVMVAFCAMIGLVGRVWTHYMDDSVRGQRMGSWIWTALLVLIVITDCFGYGMALASESGFMLNAFCKRQLHDFRLLAMVLALVNGSHGLSFRHKFALTVLMLFDGLLATALCGRTALIGEAMLAVGFVVAHMAEMHLRHSYVEKERLQNEEKQKDGEMEERMEQLQAEKERLMYDMQRRGRPLDDDNRSAIRRGLQGTHPSEAGGPAPSDSPPPSLPPGAPSSTAGESSIAPPPVSDAGSMSDMSEVEEAVTDLMGDEEVVLELQSSGCSAARAQGALQLELRGVLELQSSPPAGSEGGGESDGAKPPASLGAVPRAENVADVAVVHQPRVIAHRVQEAVDSTPQEQGGKRQRQEPHLQVGPRVGVLVGLPVRPPVNPSCGPLPESLDHGQGNRTPRQQALHVARQSLQVTRTDLEIFQVVRALSLALGSVRTESGTVKAVHAVLLQMNRPEMSEKEAYTSTGASMSNFKKWRRRIQHAELNLPPP